MRIIVWERNPLTENAVAAFGGVLPHLSMPFQMCINTDNLHAEEIGVWTTPGKFKLRLMQVFIHELAHFVTKDEKEANRLSFETLRAIMEKKE